MTEEGKGVGCEVTVYKARISLNGGKLSTEPLPSFPLSSKLLSKGLSVLEEAIFHKLW